MDAIRKAADTLADETRNKINEVAEEALEKGRQSLKEYGVRGEKLWKEARQRGNEALDQAGRLVRRYPSRAIGLALLVGTVLGALIFYPEDR